MTPALKIALGSLVIGVVVLGLKTLAWYVTGSVALFSDALESIVNVATAIAALFAVRIAAVPADERHPYGHHKAEFFSAVLEGVLIVVAALIILHEAWGAVLAPRALDAPLSGLLINAFATLINFAWCRILLSRGRALKSPALVADGHHLFADVLTSAGVAIGILLALTTGWWLLDPLMAVIVALNILWSGWKIIRASLSGLLDEAVPEEVLARIQAVIATEASGAVQAHDLRTRHAGAVTFIDFHLIVPGEKTVAEAHDICDTVEAALMAAVPDANITIHVEPEHKAKRAAIDIPEG
ncbi:cation diffusion facilitator family transporter [Algicella marina]|uniref:Protein p34 n=1 Tax=Algicella marina TaxID=2683284 RepID=A0A6P1T7D8_9RHOB|nr:cation diffusion facilitator family transporter [Algicella marina]QHQ37416.1 cation diffusion facilitator family transporter [Algicella marina]